MNSDHEINIDNALNFLNSQISKFEKKVNNQSKRDSYILHTEALGNKTFDISEREDDDFEEDEDDVILNMSFEKQPKSSIFMKPFDQRDIKGDNMLPKYTHRSKASLTSNILENSAKDIETDIFPVNEKKDLKNNGSSNSFLFSSNNDSSLTSFKYMPNISRSNVKPKSAGSHGYLDSSYGPAGTSSSSASSPFINQTSQFGGSTVFSSSTSPFNKHYNTENNEVGINGKKTPTISQNSFKRTNSIKRSTSLKKYTNNLNLYLTNNNIGINNSNHQIANKANQPIMNLQSKLEHEGKIDNKSGTDYRKQRGSFSRDSELDTLEFISKQPPPSLAMPHRCSSSSGSNNMIPLSSSNTGSSLYSSGSNQLGLFCYKSNDNKTDSLSDDFAFNREELNKTPIVSIQGHNTLIINGNHDSNKKLPPKTPDRTNDLLYKLNTDMNFEAESIEVMSAMSQNSFGSGNLNPSNSMIFNKYDLLKISEHGSSNLTLSETRNQAVSEVDTHVDQALKKIIHLPAITTKMEYNQDGIALLNTNEMIRMITENEKKKTLIGNELFIIDCRFPREYEQGHIKDSLNIYDFERLFDFLKHLLTTSTNSQMTQCKIVFYCEFSQYRSPKMSKFLRKLDRLINIKYWPYLIYPDLFILNGGIYKFQESNMGFMEGQYKSMTESYKDHNGELDDHLRVFRKQVSGYLGEDNDTSKKNNDHDTFDKMVYLKNDLMDCIEHRI